MSLWFYLCQCTPVHVGTSDVKVLLVYHPQFGVHDTIALHQLTHVDRLHLGKIFLCQFERVLVRKLITWYVLYNS